MSIETQIAGVLLIVIMTFGGVPSAAQSPYAGQQTRQIKALSEATINAYLHGEGMGQARAAELNSYPGPKHVLELAAELELSETQRQKTQEEFDKMHRAAMDLGHEIVEAEQRLNDRFAKRTITAETLGALVEEIGHLRSKLRAVHLRAHLQMVEVLSPEQVERYDSLRGYGAGHGHSVRSHSGDDLAHGGNH